MQHDTTQAQPLTMPGTIDSRIGPLGFEGGYRLQADRVRPITHLIDQ